VNKFARITLTAFVFALIFAPATIFAQDGTAAETTAQSVSMFKNLISIGAGMVVIGAGYGIGKIGASSVESMARQPEVAADIRGAMILAAALVEGAAMFALIVCLLGYLL